MHDHFNTSVHDGSLTTKLKMVILMGKSTSIGIYQSSLLFKSLSDVFFPYCWAVFEGIWIDILALRPSFKLELAILLLSPF